MSGVKVEFKGIRPAELAQQVEKAVRLEILVGIPRPHPEHKEARKDDGKGDGKKESAFNGLFNADLAAIHENGAPARRIPARPFIKPGIERAKETIAAIAAKGAAAIVRGQSLRPYAEKAGLEAQKSIRDVFTNNDWKAISPRTIIARAYRTVRKKAPKSARARRGMFLRELARRAGDRALIDTGQLRQAINYVVREGARK